MRTFVTRLAENDGGKIDYAKMIRLINWRMNPVERPGYSSLVSDEGWMGNQPAAQVKSVNVHALLLDLGGISRGD